MDVANDLINLKLAKMQLTSKAVQSICDIHSVGSQNCCVIRTIIDNEIPLTDTIIKFMRNISLQNKSNPNYSPRSSIIDPLLALLEEEVKRTLPFPQAVTAMTLSYLFSSREKLVNKQDAGKDQHDKKEDEDPTPRSRRPSC